MPTALRSLKQRFLDALAVPPAERAAWLSQECADDAALRQQLELMLAAHEAPQSLLDRVAPPAAPGPVTQDISGETIPAGTMIGPYKLLQQIGEGGMGVVYMAEQTEPVQRRVALKIIKPGMDTRQVIARFEAERQALAMMDHPNIAKVFDAGTTDSGRPYFVMELVRGAPITKYCDEHHLTLKARLELFLPVCQAVQHAHQKGIIHRDLKPTNVLVAQYDDKPVPKVIDFGVAKAAQKLTERTMFTEFGQVVGTLEYMSPEQAQLNQLDIDTRSDIYSLGVILYELLTGCTPFDGKRLRTAAFDEMLRIIREEEPPRPSTRLSSAETLPSVAASRSVEPARLGRALRGELDWIVMKALEKDRNRRYETTNGLATDIERYLRDEPVQACPPSAAYRFRKFTRRNKGPMLAATLVVVALVGGVIGTTWGMLRATFAEADAVREAGEKTVALREKEAALGSAKANEIQAKAAQKDAQDNLKDALAAVDQMLTHVAEDRLTYVPQMEPIRRDLLLDALKFYQKFLDKQSDDPVIRREAVLAHRRVGRIHHQLGQHKDAELAYRNALELFDKLGPSASADPALLIEMVLCHIEFSWPLNHLGKLDESRQHIRRAVEVADKLDKRAPGNLAYILNARNNLASILLSEQPHEAEQILQANLELADDAFNLEAAHRGLRTVFMFTGRLPEAEESARQALKYAEQMAAENPSANWVQAALANDQRDLAGVIMKERPKEAQELQGRAIAILDKLATDFPTGPNYRKDLAEALIQDAGLLKQLGKTDDAEKTYRRAIDVHEKLAIDFPTMPGLWQGLARAHCELALMLSRAGKKEEAEAAFRRVVTLSEKLRADFAGKPEHRRELAQCHMFAAGELRGARLYADADRLYGWALQHRLALVREAPRMQQSQEELALLHFTLGGYHLWGTRRLKDADRSYQAAQEIFDKLTLDFPETLAYRGWAAECRIQLGIVARREGRIQEAEQHLRQGIQLAEQVVKELPKDAWLRFYLGCGYRWLADIQRGAGSPQEVEKSLVQGLAVLDKLVAEFPNNDEYLVELSRICRSLAEHHFHNGRTEEGRRLNLRVVEISEQILAYNTASANSASWLNDSAWFLATRADGSPRPAQLAVELAKRAVANAPRAEIIKTLGTAYYRAGEWRACIDTLKKCDELQQGSQFTYNAFFIAMAHGQLGDKELARKWYTPAVLTVEKYAPKRAELLRLRAEAAALLGLSERLPDEPTDDLHRYNLIQEVNPDAAWVYTGRGFVYARLGEHGEAVAAYEKAVELDPKFASAYNALAWFLATCPDRKFRDPGQAVAHAQKAVELSPNAGPIWNTLGVAHYREGNWKEAIVALEKSMELRMGGDSADWFFLAMAHWQLGEKDKACDCFDRAAKWMDEHQPKNEELLRFRAETAELLGVEEKKG